MFNNILNDQCVHLFFMDGYLDLRYPWLRIEIPFLIDLLEDTNSIWMFRTSLGGRLRPVVMSLASQVEGSRFESLQELA